MSTCYLGVAAVVEHDQNKLFRVDDSEMSRSVPLVHDAALSRLRLRLLDSSAATHSRKEKLFDGLT